MKKIILISMLVFAACNSTAIAQAAQKRVLLQQIAALRVYGDYISRGYSIAKKGLATISDLKDGEFGLHEDFFESLELVNPAIRNYHKVGKIISLQLQIAKRFQKVSGLLYDDLFHGDETDYLLRVYGRLLKDCENNLENLFTTITDASLEMSDEQRLQRIELLYAQMQDNDAFSTRFSNEILALLKARQREKNDIQKGRILYDLNESQ